MRDGSGSTACVSSANIHEQSPALREHSKEYAYLQSFVNGNNPQTVCWLINTNIVFGVKQKIACHKTKSNTKVPLFGINNKECSKEEIEEFIRCWNILIGKDVNLFKACRYINSKLLNDENKGVHYVCHHCKHESCKMRPKKGFNKK